LFARRWGDTFILLTAVPRMVAPALVQTSSTLTKG
jgi:hypothetical protein